MRGLEASREVEAGRALLTRVGARLCAIPLAHAVETMRLLPVSPLGDAPPFVRGLTIIRGVAVPVVDLGVLLGEPAGAVTRLVLVRVDERRAAGAATPEARPEARPDRCVALAVDGVLGVVQLDPTALQSTPPLAQAAGAEMLAAVGALDAQLLVVLRASHLLTEETWLKLGLAAQ